METFEVRHFASLAVNIDEPIEMGATQEGIRRVIPIASGDVTGDGWEAKILPGGADFQVIKTSTMTLMDAKYVLETTTGDKIFVQNAAIRVASEEDTKRIKEGIPVPPERIYFRCRPIFETSSPDFAWINERMFVGKGIRTPDQVILEIFEVL